MSATSHSQGHPIVFDGTAWRYVDTGDVARHDRGCAMCEWGTDAVVRLAHPLPVSGRTEIAVDACLAPLVQILNDLGVHTVGCCCGHGRGEGSVLFKQDGEQRELKLPGSQVELALHPFETDRDA